MVLAESPVTDHEVLLTVSAETDRTTFVNPVSVASCQFDDSWPAPPVAEKAEPVNVGLVLMPVAPAAGEVTDGVVTDARVLNEIVAE